MAGSAVLSLADWITPSQHASRCHSSGWYKTKGLGC